jgi:hypothetical protein
MNMDIDMSSPAFLEMAALSYLSKKLTQEDYAVSVHWDKRAPTAADPVTYITGSITLGTALVAGFTYFILSGVRFRVESIDGGGRRVRFSYSGTRSVAAVTSLFSSLPVRLLFGGAADVRL